MDNIKKLIDIQNSKEDRNENIQKVGIKDLKYPVQINEPYEKTYNVPATFHMSVNLISSLKGVHMSRFLETLSESDLSISYNNVMKIIEKMRKKLCSQNAFLKIKFSYFKKKTSPISKKESYLEYKVYYTAKIVKNKKTCKIKIKTCMKMYS